MCENTPPTPHPCVLSPPPNEQQGLPPGERAQPDQIFPIVRKMHGISSGAEAAAADSTSRLRELQGSGSPAVAVAAATAHELSLEKDTWSLLLMMNAADKDDAAITEEARRRGGSARGGVTVALAMTTSRCLSRPAVPKLRTRRCST